MEGCQHSGHHYDHCAYDVVEHLGTRVYVFAKLEAVCCIAATIRVRVLILSVFAVGKTDYARARDKHHDPHRSTDEERMNPPEAGHLLSFVVEHHQARNEDDHIEDKRHVHVDVDHAADHFTPPETHSPVLSRVIVDPEGHSKEEDEVGKDEVEDCNGGGGRRAGLHDVHHQAQADGSAEQNHRVDSQEDCVVLISIIWLL